jgi:TcpE family
MANRTYRKLFLMKTVVTSIGNFSLVRWGLKITTEGLITFLICVIPAKLLQPFISEVFHMRPIFVIFGLACLGAWASGKVNAHGKPIPLYLIDFAMYLFRPKQTNGWEPIKLRRKPQKISFKAKRIFRRTPPLS